MKLQEMKKLADQHGVENRLSGDGLWLLVRSRGGYWFQFNEELKDRSYLGWLETNKTTK